MRITLLLTAVTVVLGCSSSTDEPIQFGPKLSETVAIDVDSAMTEFPIEFLSWGGEWQGTDMDTELTLNADGTARLSYFGYAADHVDATWTASGDELTLNADLDQLAMPGGHDWPTLQLRQANGRLYLFPTRETECLEYGNGSTGWPLGEVGDE